MTGCKQGTWTAALLVVVYNEAKNHAHDQNKPLPHPERKKKHHHSTPIFQPDNSVNQLATQLAVSNALLGVGYVLVRESKAKQPAPFWS